jgi:hypothetical protein
MRDNVILQNMRLRKGDVCWGCVHIFLDLFYFPFQGTLLQSSSHFVGTNVGSDSHVTTFTDKTMFGLANIPEGSEGT